MAFVRAIVRATSATASTPRAALAEAQIAPRDLKDPQARVTAAQFEALSGFAMQELDDEALGWFCAPPALGQLRHAVPRLAGRARPGRRDQALVPAPPAADRGHHARRCKVAGGVATVSITRASPRSASFREFCLVSNLRFLHGYACWAIDSRVSLREAAFPFEAPPHRDAYPLMFGGELRFGADAASYSFDERYLALPLQRDERALRTMLRRALPLTVLQYRRDRLLGQRVRELLRTRGGEAATAEALAALLNLSARTLHRQLQEEGVSLQALKDEVRHEQAADQLRRTDRPIKQIALAVGFRNEKSFSRAFRAWAGVTPGAFRRGGASEAVRRLAARG